jgi:hypothetical protein
MGNLYNSPCLAHTLKTLHKTDCVGTLEQPKITEESERHKTWGGGEGEITAQHCGPVSVTKWSDKSSISFPHTTVMTQGLLQ